MRAFALWVVFMLTGCAGMTAQDAAVRATNALGVSLDQADKALAPQLKAELAEADRAYPDNDVAYREAVAAPLKLFAGFEAARDAQRWMHLALEQWEAGDGGEMWRDVAPCGVEALDHVVELLDAEDTPLQVMRDSLKAIAGDGSCRCPKCVVSQ